MLIHEENVTDYWLVKDGGGASSCLLSFKPLSGRFFCTLIVIVFTAFYEYHYILVNIRDYDLLY